MARPPRPVDPDFPPDPSRVPTLLLIGVGGAIGTLLRFVMESAVPLAPNGWPAATFLINISGAFLLAVFLETLALHGPDNGWRRRLRLGVGTGVLGGYTTYSTFMVETALLGGGGQYLIALAYVAASVVLGLVAAWSGMAIVASVLRRGSTVQT